MVGHAVRDGEVPRKSPLPIMLGKVKLHGTESDALMSAAKMRAWDARVIISNAV